MIPRLIKCKMLILVILIILVIILVEQIGNDQCGAAIQTTESWTQRSSSKVETILTEFWIGAVQGKSASFHVLTVTSKFIVMSTGRQMLIQSDTEPGIRFFYQVAAQ